VLVARKLDFPALHEINFDSKITGWQILEPVKLIFEAKMSIKKSIMDLKVDSKTKVDFKYHFLTLNDLICTHLMILSSWK